MKKLTTLFFAVVMSLSMVFISGEITSDKSFSANAQQVTVRRKRNVGIARKTSRGAKYVGRKTWQGTKYVGRKTYQGGKYVGKKTVKGTRATVSRAKKILY